MHISQLNILPFQASVFPCQSLNQILTYFALYKRIFRTNRIINQNLSVDFVVVYVDLIFAPRLYLPTNFIFHILNPLLLIIRIQIKGYFTLFQHLLNLTLQRVTVVHQKFFLFGHLEKLWVCLNF